RQGLIQAGLAPERVFTLLNPVDTTAFYPDPQVPKQYDLSFVGYLRFPKRVDLLLQALAEMRQTRPETNLLIIGNGAERDNLETLADTLHVGAGVTFVGWQDNVVDYLRQSRMLVLLSEHEGLPVVALEAMSTGLPVLLTDVGSCRTVVRDGKNGYLVDSPADPHLVAERLLGLLTDPERYAQFSAEALTVRETHDMRQVTRNWERILTVKPLT
ncbi:MAG TPA: glycosyltransferase, partial [Phototrophicaceae bacterium]|nr:glycosyltransferase [Phototrophicaceae bacterium]